MDISVLVCDDLNEARGDMIRKLRDYEARRGVEIEIDTAANGTELLSMWRPGRWSIIFLDIYMPEMDGIEVARRLRAADPACEIVMVTTSRDHGITAYELHAMDYLTKPYTQEDVDEVMDWFLKQRTERSAELNVRTQEGDCAVRTEDIRYIESRGHNCVIHAGRQELNVRATLDELLGDLGETGFFRCHQSFLVNFRHISQAEKRFFLTDSGERVPISASNLARSKTALLEWVALQNR